MVPSDKAAPIQPPQSPLPSWATPVLSSLTPTHSECPEARKQVRDAQGCHLGRDWLRHPFRVWPPPCLGNNLRPCCIIWSLALAALGNQPASQASLSLAKLLHQPGRQERPLRLWDARQVASQLGAGPSLWNVLERQPQLFETERYGCVWLGKRSTPRPSEKTAGPLSWLSSPRHLRLISPSESKGPNSSLLRDMHT